MRLRRGRFAESAGESEGTGFSATTVCGAILFTTGRRLRLIYREGQSRRGVVLFSSLRWHDRMRIARARARDTAELSWNKLLPMERESGHFRVSATARAIPRDIFILYRYKQTNGCGCDHAAGLSVFLKRS